jgi:hypothetical protein
VLWVPAAWPFADRELLRAVVCAIARGDGPAAIAIDAPAGHGKRTMCSYIEGCARRHGVLPIVEPLGRFVIGMARPMVRARLARHDFPPDVDPPPSRLIPDDLERR